ncbi:MAG TPA: PQQ-binding-like beta-propeller repeat protein, partial [Pirellulales bacterium]|nr:PQQ-binding-like beta-propeller repeat protein [Pirellulales bacterium]
MLAEAPELPGTLDERCDLIDELALLSDGNEGLATKQVVDAYVALGRHSAEEKLWQPYSRIRRRMVESPALHAINTASLVEPLVRAEILELVYHDAWDELAALCKRLEFFDSSTARHKPADRQQAAQLVDWAAALVRRNRPTKGEPGGAIPPSWRHPLIEQLGKEGFNVLAELDAALAGNSYQEACKLISSVTPREATGLLPNSADPALLVSLPGAVALAMRDHPALRETMQSEFAPLGQLRLRQATAADDVDGVEAVTIQFYGTTAARQAHVWLGDRALAAGDFSEAEFHYQQANDEAAGEADASIAARLRLAGAMQGREVGQPVEVAVQLGDERIKPAAFEKMIDEMLARSPAVRSRDAHQRSPWLLVFPGGVEPAGYRAKSFERVNVAVAKRPAVADDVPWDPVAAETTLTLTTAAALVCNPAEIAAYDRSTGKPLWKIPGDAPPQRGSLWPPVAMRPTTFGSAVFSRRWQAGSAQLICIDDGRIAWQTSSGLRVASDPVVLDERVLAVTSAALPQEMLELSLTAFDPRSGQQLAQHPLAQFRDLWQHEMPCELALAGDTVLVVGGGCTLGCTRDGEPKWLRRETWVGGVVDQRTWPRHYGAPLIEGPLACVAQPGVPAVSCVETANGRLVWQRPLADLLRLVSVLPGKL